ncbi:MAG: hypothetical protein SFT91_05125, partial [Rickettsiaceae bacterium]|nr:hypothetical protein [Rickettsiaceae bacterium]
MVYQNFRRYLYPVILIPALSSLLVCCWPYYTSSEYSENFRVGYSTSKPIYLSIKNTKKNTLYLLLERNINLDEFFIKIRW